MEGPYYFDPDLQRGDITEGRQGVPLALRLIVVEAGRCVPLAKARVDIWHASAEGHYSGYQGQGDDRAVDTRGQKFLRGTLATNERGETLFRTIYPGWYRGRTTHIHFKVFIEERNVLTGQIYFPDALSEYIYANVRPYNARVTRRDTFNSTDGIARMDPAHGGFCDIKEEPDGYLATLIIGADPAATAVAQDRGRLPPPGPPPAATLTRTVGHRSWGIAIRSAAWVTQSPCTIGDWRLAIGDWRKLDRSHLPRKILFGERPAAIREDAPLYFRRTPAYISRAPAGPTPGGRMVYERDGNGGLEFPLSSHLGRWI